MKGLSQSSALGGLQNRMDWQIKHGTKKLPSSDRLYPMNYGRSCRSQEILAPGSKLLKYQSTLSTGVLLSPPWLKLEGERLSGSKYILNYSL